MALRELEDGRVELKLTVTRAELTRCKKTGHYLFCDEEFLLGKTFEVEAGIVCPVQVKLSVVAIPTPDQTREIEAILQSERNNVVNHG